MGPSFPWTVSNATPKSCLDMYALIPKQNRYQNRQRYQPSCLGIEGVLRRAFPRFLLCRTANSHRFRLRWIITHPPCLQSTLSRCFPAIREGRYSHHYVASQMRAIRIRRDFFDVRDGFQVIRYGIYEYTLIAIAITCTTIISEYFVSIFTAGCWSLELTQSVSPEVTEPRHSKILHVGVFNILDGNAQKKGPSPSFLHVLHRLGFPQHT